MIVRLAFVVTLLVSTVALAKSVPHLRVIVPRATVRTGPAATYRELYRAERGEVLEVIDRNDTYWFRVLLPDGRFGWIYGEQALPVDVDLNASAGSVRWDRFKSALFAPSRIPDSWVGFTFSGGVLGGDGMFMFRPSVTLNSHFAVEGHVGEAIGSDGSLLVYGVDGNIYIYPLGPFVPFVALGAGGASSFPKVNGVTQASKTQWAVDAGAGAMLIFKKWITLRFDFRNYTLFTPNSTSNRQEYSGGLAVFF